MLKKVSVIGLGYIGLPTAAILANRGCEVVGVDINENTVKTINEGKIHIVEPDLEALVHSAVISKKLRAKAAAEKSDVFLIAVPTPFKEGHTPDLSYIEAAAKAISPFLEKGNLVILESTSPVGTTEKLKKWLGKEEIYVAYCPERVLPGHILKEIVGNDRIIGGLTAKCGQKALALYQIFVEGECLVTDARTAEMTKLTENAFRDVNIAFANELSLICQKLDINIWELISLANRHPRVNILQPGPGVGGHCIAVDPWFIVNSAPELAKLIQTAREVNDAKPKHVIAEAKKKIQSLKDPVIACFGLSFKPDIDDIRESPALEIVKELAKEKIKKLLVVEPHLKELPKDLKAPHIEHVEVEEALKTADFCLLLVNHKKFMKIERSNLKDKHILDTRGIWV